MGLRTLTFLLACLLASGCAKREPRNSGDQSAPPAGNVADLVSVEKRSDKAPNFSWKDSTGKLTDFEAFHGKVTFINFWATWCGPCKKELPDLVTLSREMADRNVRFIGISTDRGANIIEDVRSFVREQGIPYQIVISNDDLEDAFGNPRAIPTSFLVDADGKIVRTIVGMQSKQALSEAITAVLK